MWLALVLAVLALHALLLGRLPRGAGPAPSAAPVLQVRQLPAPAAQALPAATAVAGTPRPAPPPRPRAQAVAPPAAAASATAAAAVAAEAASSDDSAPAMSSPAAAGGTPPPRYATRLPPAATLQYTLQRDEPARPGREGLQAELRWRPEADRYTLTLGYAATGWASVGGIDAQGLAPERLVETRRGRETRAASFHREAGPGGWRITYSGPSVAHALLPGAQDRLSWLLQLPAVLEADPALARPGRTVELFVAGVRGDAGWWLFTVIERGPAELPAGRVADAVHLQRLPERPYDTRVDVWLDPARHHLPVRLRLQQGVDIEGRDFRLVQFSQP